MNLRNKVWLVSGVTLAVMLAVIVFIARTIYLDGYLSIEKQSVEKNIDRVLNALKSANQELSIQTGDWSSWDDTYAFVQDLNPEYIGANIYADTFRLLNINYMLFLDNNGDIVFQRGYDDSGAEINLPAPFLEILTQDRTMSSHQSVESDVRGFIRLDNQVLMFVSKPILQNMSAGPIMGSLIFARSLDQYEFTQLSEVTQLTLTWFPLQSNQIPGDVHADLLGSQNEFPSVIRPENDQTISTYILIRDINHQPAFMIQFVEPRTFYSRGLKSVNLILLLVLAAGLISSLAVYAAVEALVITRLKKIIRMISAIHKNNTWDTRLPAQGTDEIGTLSLAVNEMLDVRQKMDEEINRLARVDTLTGLLNRFAMEEIGRYEINRAQRTRMPLAIMMMDFDDFKEVNDTYSHLVGDQLLRGLAGIVRSLVRTNDILCRYGGDEFLLILPDSDQKVALIVAERIRAGIESAFVPTDSGPLHITASIGVTITQVGENDLMLPLKRADQALYASKRMGKNRIHFFEEWAS